MRRSGFPSVPPPVAAAGLYGTVIVVGGGGGTHARWGKRGLVCLEGATGARSMNRESPHPDASRDGPVGPSPVPGRLHIRQVEDAIRPALGAVVMASGVVSIDLYSDHRLVLSAITLWFALVVWLLLAVVVGVRLAYERAGSRARPAHPPGSRAWLPQPCSAPGWLLLITTLSQWPSWRCRESAGPWLSCRSCGTGRPRRSGSPCPHDGH